MAFDEAAIRTMVSDWYVALDRHEDLSSVLEYLVDDGLELRFPEGTSRGHQGLAQWYETATNRFFDEVHTVQSVEVDNLAAARADVEVVVNWKARMWNPPAPESEWLDFDAYQTWQVVSGPGGRPQVKTYIVDKLEPRQGSATL